MGKFNSDDYYIYYCGQESLRRNRVALIVNKRVQNAVLACNLKNDRMISVLFQGKPFNITVIQVYALTSNAEEAEVEQFYEDLQDIFRTNNKRGEMGREIGGRFKRERIYVYLWLIHVEVWQKTAKFCKAITHQ